MNEINSSILVISTPPESRCEEANHETLATPEYAARIRCGCSFRELQPGGATALGYAFRRQSPDPHTRDISRREIVPAPVASGSSDRSRAEVSPTHPGCAGSDRIRGCGTGAQFRPVVPTGGQYGAPIRDRLAGATSARFL